MTTLWARNVFAAAAVAMCTAAGAQFSTADTYDRCIGNPSAFAQDENLNEVVAGYLANMQKEIDSSLEIARVAGMAGLEERSKQARSKADQYRQELRQACAHLGQSMNKADQRPKADPVSPAYATQTAGGKREAVFEQEMNLRIPGATFLMNEAAFSQWLDGRQGKAPRRDLWDQAILAEDFEQAAKILRDYERESKSR